MLKGGCALVGPCARWLSGDSGKFRCKRSGWGVTARELLEAGGTGRALLAPAAAGADTLRSPGVTLDTPPTVEGEFSTLGISELGSLVDLRESCSCRDESDAIIPNSLTIGLASLMSRRLPAPGMLSVLPPTTTGTDKRVPEMV